MNLKKYTLLEDVTPYNGNINNQSPENNVFKNSITWQPNKIEKNSFSIIDINKDKLITKLIKNHDNKELEKSIHLNKYNKIK